MSKANSSTKSRGSRRAARAGNFRARIRALHDIDLAIVSALDLQTVLSVLLEKIELVFTHNAVSLIRLVDKNSGLLESVACRNLEENEWRAGLGKESGISKAVFDTKLPAVIRNVQVDPRTQDPTFFVRYGLVSYIGAPLIVKDQVLGVLDYYIRNVHRFSSHEIEFFVTLAGQAAVAIQNARLYEETEAHLKRIEALHEIDKAITSTLDLQAVLDLLLEKIEVFLSFPAATTIRLFNRVTGKFENTACRNIDEQLWKAQVGQGTGNLSLEILQTKKPVIVRDIRTDRQRKAGEFYRKHGFVSYLGVPLTAKDEVLGILGFYTNTGHEFTQQEIDFLLTLAGQAAIAIHNSQLYEEIGLSKTELEQTTRYLDRSLKQLGRLYTALTPIDATTSAQEMMGGIIDRLLDATGADAALIRLWDKKADRFPIVSQRNFPDDYLQRVEAASSGNAVNWVIKHDEPLISPDIGTEPRFKGKIQLQLGLRSCAMLPLKVHGEVRGVMHIASHNLGYFDEGQRDHLIAIARQMSIALENRELFYELKSSRDELERANKIKDEFLGVVSHELRTPINVIMGYTTLLKQEAVGEVKPAQRNALDKISAISSDLLAMVDSILCTTSLEANQIIVEKEEFNFVSLLAEIKANYELIQSKKIGLIWGHDGDVLLIKSDRRKLKHIISNLINNAVKFTEYGQISISARRFEDGSHGTGTCAELTAGGWIELKVTDTGVGIPRQTLAHIFNKFYQVDSSRTRGYGGVGLGLYIVKKFTELLGGKVEVESELGQGSTFIVTIPAGP